MRKRERNSLVNNLIGFFLQILAEFTVYADNTIGAVPGSFDPNNNNEQLDINALINSSNDCKCLWNIYISCLRYS
jgi:hypothetical protein